MNQDQLYNLIQKVVILASGAAVTKGVGDSSLWETIGGAIAAIVTWYISHKWNATPAAPAPAAPTQPPTPPISMGGAIHLLFAIGVAGALIVGCTTSQQKAAVNSLYSIDQTTTAAVDAFDTLVIQGQVPTNDVPKISKAYNDYHAAFLIAVDAVQYNTNAIAPPNLVIEANDIVNLINTVKGNKK